MAAIQIVVVTPETTALDQSVDYVAIPLLDGEAGVLPGHAPMIGRLGPGELRVRSGSKEDSYYVDGGFVQIADNVVSVLTGKSLLASDIDLTAAKEALKKAKEMAGGKAELLELKQKAVSQANAQIRLAERGKA